MSVPDHLRLIFVQDNIDLRHYQLGLFIIFNIFLFIYSYTYEELEETARFLKKSVPFTPQIGIICGSGLGKPTIQMNLLNVCVK